MAFTIRLIKHLWHNPEPPKKADALRFGLIGASNIAPLAVITPAKSHPEVIIAAVAARDEEKARKYARKYNIPIVHNSYQDLLDDPAIDVVYIALPNAYHYEWAVKGLKAGKHVLLEKPSTSNAIESKSLFKHPSLTQPKPPILLEALHIQFHPSFRFFISLLDPQSISHATTKFNLFAGYFSPTDIRYNYSLSGGSLMDLGAYNVFCLRSMFSEEPEECIEAKARTLADRDKEVDQALNAKWRFPNGGIGEVECDMAKRGGYWWDWATGNWPKFDIPMCSATHRERVLPDDRASSDEEHIAVKKVTMWNMMAPSLWHRIDIETTHLIRNKMDKKVLKEWKEIEYKKAYTSPKESESVGEDHWTTYRWMLEGFVDRIKGREGTGVWMSGDESIGQMVMIDEAYKKAGLPLRPTSSTLLAE